MGDTSAQDLANVVEKGRHLTFFDLKTPTRGPNPRVKKSFGHINISEPGHPALARASARVIGSRRDAMAGAEAAASERGYHPIVVADPIVGEARDVAPGWLDKVRTAATGMGRPACVISSGETTVRVTGRGTGGRSLELALAAAELVSGMPGTVAAASIGTDGIDGTSGVAGALVDSTTMARAHAAGLEPPSHYLAANDSFAFFASLDDVIRLGRTDTNVGDLQVILIEQG